MRKMEFDGNDFIILGLGLGAGAAVLFAKAYLLPSFAAETAMTFFDTNPFIVRNNIAAKHEAVAGLGWLILGLAASLIGIIRTVRGGHSGYLISSIFDIVVLLATLLVLWRFTIAITDRTSRAEYLPVVAKLQRELFSRDSFHLFHEGLSPEESKRGIVVSAEAKEARLRPIGENLERIGKLLDEPRRDKEDDKSYARRLAAYFPGVPLD